MIGKLLSKRYQISHCLIAGTFGQTYIAEDLHQPGNSQCVVKRIRQDPSFDLGTLPLLRQRFTSEAETLKQLSHEQIPQLLASFEENQEFYLVQEFIQGHQLTAELPTRNRVNCWTEARVVHLLQDVLRILEFIHRQGYIHCDLKPNNLVRRASDGKLFLIDFGAVQPVRPPRTELLTAKTTRSNHPPLETRSLTAKLPEVLYVCDPHLPSIELIAPLGYIPAEQLTGQPHPSSDIYALSLIAIQALTGLEPLRLKVDFNTGEVIWQNFVPDLNPQLAAVLNQMLSYHVKDRYQSATEALQALQHLNVAIGEAGEGGRRGEGERGGGHGDTGKSGSSLGRRGRRGHGDTNTSPRLGVWASGRLLSPRHPVTPSPLLTGVGIGLAVNSLAIGFGIYSLLYALPSEPVADSSVRAKLEHQPQDFTTAIAMAIFPTHSRPTAPEVQPLHEQDREAQAQHLLQQAYDQAARHNFTAALALLKQIPPQSAAGAKIHPKLLEYNHKQQIRANYLLQQAYSRAAVSDFTTALSYLKQIPKDTTAYERAVVKIPEYTHKQHFQALVHASLTARGLPRDRQVEKFATFYPDSRLQEVNIN